MLSGYNGGDAIAHRLFTSTESETPTAMTIVGDPPLSSCCSTNAFGIVFSGLTVGIPSVITRATSGTPCLLPKAELKQVE